MNPVANRDPAHTTRREVLLRSVAGAFAFTGLGLKGNVVAAVVDETPGVTEGPYWVDELLNRSDVRSDPTTGVVQAGLPLYLAVTVSQINADGTITPLSGAQVDIWHASAYGYYSDIESDGTAGQKYLRGYQKTTARGVVKFTTIYPGWYSGRTPHIHARVRTYDATGTVAYNFTTQFFFDDTVTNEVFATIAPYANRDDRDTTNANDSIFNGSSFNGEPAEDAGEYLMLRLFENKSRANASFNMVLDLTDTANEDNETGTPGGGGGNTPPTGGGGPGGGGGGGTGGGGTPPTGGPGGGGTPPTGGGGPGGTPPTGAGFLRPATANQYAARFRTRGILRRLA